MIIAAAICQDGVVYTLPAPARHHHIISYMNICPENGGCGVGYKHGVNDSDDQGFLDSERGFVRRTVAKHIAVDCGQIIEGRGQHRELFSEDLW